MIILFTDYGVADPYLGLMKLVIQEHSPGAMIVDLLHNAPDYSIRSSAHLLAALSSGFPIGSACVAVVDPGVGTERGAVVMLADEKWYIGPDNGLLSVVAGRAAKAELWRIDWRPEKLSSSFHGRDLFAPIAAMIERGAFPHSRLSDIPRLEVNLSCSDLAEVIYIDHYGNLMIGIIAAQVEHATQLRFSSCLIGFAPVFSAAKPGQPFWYENSLGLVEIALDCASAAQFLSAQIGDQFEILPA
mgnify:CR=1 FL=1